MKFNKYLLGISILIVVGLFIFYKNIDPLQYPYYPKCPIKQVTGFDCPGCGNQRALHELLNGNFRAAFNYNPLTFILLPYLIFGFYIQMKQNLSPKLLNIRKVLYGYKAIILVVSLILLYTIGRNIV